MSQNIEILRRIGWNLVLLVMFVAIGGALLLNLNGRLKDAQLAHREVFVQLADIRGKLLGVNIEKQDVLQNFARYQEMQARGYIGNEHRAEWVEQIDEIKTRRKLLDIQYELAPQQLLVANMPNKGGDMGNHAGYELFASNMKLHMQLLHEEDLLNFFADLRNQAQAFIRIRGCDVEQLAQPEAERGSMAQLKAECSVDWITMRETKAGQP